MNVGGEGLQFTYERGGKLYFQLYFSGVAVYMYVHTHTGAAAVVHNCNSLGLQFTHRGPSKEFFTKKVLVANTNCVL